MWGDGQETKWVMQFKISKCFSVVNMVTGWIMSSSVNRVCWEGDQKGQHPHGGHRREPRSTFSQRHDRPGGTQRWSISCITSPGKWKPEADKCVIIPLRTFHLWYWQLDKSERVWRLFSAGNVWEAGEWTKGDQHQPRGSEEELSGADWAQTHPASHPAVLWWGCVFTSHLLERLWSLNHDTVSGLQMKEVFQISILWCSCFQMEDPNLLEESSALMEGSEGGRGAPLRLG